MPISARDPLIKFERRRSAEPRSMSACGAKAPSRSLAEWDSTHFLAISPGFAGLVAGSRRSAHAQLQGGKIVARSAAHRVYSQPPSPELAFTPIRPEP
jgi:hypothetical protein